MAFDKRAYKDVLYILYLKLVPPWRSKPIPGNDDLNNFKSLRFCPTNFERIFFSILSYTTLSPHCGHTLPPGIMIWLEFTLSEDAFRQAPLIWPYWGFFSEKGFWNIPTNLIINNHLIFTEGFGLHLNKPEAPLTSDVLCQVWLESAQLFWRRWQYEKFTTRTTPTPTPTPDDEAKQRTKYWSEKPI